MAEVFLDTHGLAAYVNQDDPYHDIAYLQGEELITSGARFVTTFAIITETAELLLTRLKHRGRAQIMHTINTAIEFIFTLEDAGMAEIVQVDEQLCRRALKLMNRMSDKNWGLTDCISFVVMKDRGMEEALTGDEHFSQAGFRGLLKD